MSQAVSLGRVGRSAIVAVLLLACFSFAATVSAEEPEGTIVTEETVTRLPVTGSAEGPLAMGAADIVCATQTVTKYWIGNRLTGSSIWWISETDWCYNGTVLAHNPPEFDTDHREYGGWEYDHREINERGDIGDRQHWDTARGYFESCLRVAGVEICSKRDLKIEKWQRGDGSTDYS